MSKRRKYRLRKPVKKFLWSLGVIGYLTGGALTTPVEASSVEVLNLVNVKSTDNIKSVLSDVYDKPVVDVRLDSNTSGLHFATVQSKASEDTLKVTSEVQPIIILDDKHPEIKLKSDTAQVYLDNTFDPLRQITSIHDDSGFLPTLEITDNVDTSKEGTYSVSYKVINIQGLSTEKTIQVEVRESEEQRIEREAREEAERKAREEAERRAREEAARIEAERQAQLIAAQEAAAAQSYTTTASATPQYGGGSNPYSGGWGNCTWGAWQLAHDIAGVSLPGWGNAGTWLWSAQSSGYATGSEPRVNSIVVMSNHVAFVTGVSGDQIYVKEGNFAGSYHEGWCPGYGSVYGQVIIGYIYL